MSIKEARLVGTSVLGTLMVVAFGLYAGIWQDPHTAGSREAQVILIFIGVGIAATIVLQIVLSIAFSVAMAVSRARNGESVEGKELSSAIDSEMLEDERDHTIELKGLRVSHIVSGAGILLAIVLYACGLPLLVMLDTVFLSLSVSGVVEGVVRLVLYRRGV